MRSTFTPAVASGATSSSARRRLPAWLALLTLSLAICGPLPAAEDATIDVLRYDFSLELSDEEDRLQGDATIEVRFSSPDAATFELDLVGIDDEGLGMVVAEVVGEDGLRRPFEHQGDRLQIARWGEADSFAPSGVAAGDPAPEIGRFRIRYGGVPADGLIIGQNRHGERTFFGDNWPQRARHWLPTVDDPADKAICAFAVTAPAHYQVVANGRLLEETDVGGGMRRTHWESTAPLATKVMVIGVARFAVQHLESLDGLPLQSWVFLADRDAGFHHLARSAGIVRFFVDRLGRFPYAKLASVQASTRYGGMENASAIFYHEDAIGSVRDWDGLLSHEIAHQWFGDSVTEAEWRELWLSEGFATYFSRLFVESKHGRDRFVGVMRAGRERLRDYVAEHPALLLRPETVADPQEQLNPLSYEKGAWVLHMLRRRIGEEVLWRAARDYVRTYSHRNARSEDFLHIVERRSGEELGWFFRQWLERSGIPGLGGEWSWQASSQSVLLSLRQSEDPPYRLLVDVGARQGGTSFEPVPVELDETQTTVVLPFDREPDELLLDPGAWLLYSGSLERRSVDPAE